MLDKIGNIGNIISREVLIEEFELIETKEPYYISENIIFPGEIPNYLFLLSNEINNKLFIVF